MRLPLFSSLCSLAAASLLAACSPQEQPVAPAAAPSASEPAHIVLNASSSVTVTRGPNGEIIISDAPKASYESRSEVAIEQAWQEDQAEEEDRSEEEELLEDDNGQVYRALGDGTYEAVESVQTAQTTETIQTQETATSTPSRSTPDCDPKHKAAAKRPSVKAAKAPSQPAAALGRGDDHPLGERLQSARAQRLRACDCGL